MVDTKYREFLNRVATEDVEVLEKKDKEYGASWKRRGGVGAFMMLARKWDRIETALEIKDLGEIVGYKDIFIEALSDERLEDLVDDIADLRRYLLLVQAEIESREHYSNPDNVFADRAAAEATRSYVDQD